MRAMLMSKRNPKGGSGIEATADPGGFLHGFVRIRLDYISLDLDSELYFGLDVQRIRLPTS